MRVVRTACDECRKEWPEEGHERYELGIVEIDKGTLFLPDNVAAPNSHTAFLNGVYCSHQCLLRRIRRLLKLDESSPLDPAGPAPPSENPTGRKIIVKDPGASQ